MSGARHNLRSLIGISAIALLLSACSMLGFSYKHMDWWILWKADDALDLSSSQKATLKPQIQKLMQWHCSVELPKVIGWLEATDQLFKQPEPSSDAIAAQVNQVDGAFKRIAEQISAPATQLLGSLSDEQVAHLLKTLAEHNKDDQKEYLEPSLAEQTRQRSERMQERLESWLGTLNPGQIRSINHWAADLGEQNQLWLDNRAKWQSELRDALNQRQSPQFAARLKQLLTAREDFYTDAYRRNYPESKQAFARLLSRLMTQANSTQRAAVSQRLTDLQLQLKQQVCTPA